MSNLFVPGQPPSPQPGVQVNVAVDGPAVVLQVVSTSHLSWAQADGLGDILKNAALEAKRVQQAVVSPLVPGANSHRNHIVP